MFVDNVRNASKNIERVSYKTPLQFNEGLSKRYNCNVYLKREDLQKVRSYKIRGAYNKIQSLDDQTASRGIVCASAGNHAQGVAYACNKLNIHGAIFMPTTTPNQKVQKVKQFGGRHVEVILIGDTFDDAASEAISYCEKNNRTFVPPFNDQQIVEGQATVGLEIFEEFSSHQGALDYVILPIGGGGLSAGVSEVMNSLSSSTKVIGVEPVGAPSATEALKQGKSITLDEVDPFVDGASVKRIGDVCFPYIQKNIHKVVTIHEGHVCETILSLYNSDAIVLEPAGALSLCALDSLKDDIVGKNVVCVLSGSNNDILRTDEMMERALLYKGLKHYFVVTFPQRPGALKQFANQVLSPGDNITLFEYRKKNNREKAPALIGIELSEKDHLQQLMDNMDRYKFVYEYLNDNPILFQYLV